MKKLMLIASIAALAGGMAGAAGQKESGKAGSSAITVISREDGSGTRGAFIELFGVLDSNKVDQTADTAEITNSTAVMITTVAGNENAIGYISLGSLNDTVKALKIDGAPATVGNIKSGSYKISRPFNIAVKGEVKAPAQDFINFIMSVEGQGIIEKGGYIAVDNIGPYKQGTTSGKVIVAGSSSVSPIMEKLREAYLKLNPGVNVEIQQSDSSAGMTATIDGVCDIGMASRELKDSEKEKGLKETVIAIDGIAVIVNQKNSLDSLSKEQVKNIYTGTARNWTDL
jgi:phosphate transport system substrate-binding protein